jgi:SPP1 family predicted phage head-tail adaptor
MARAGKFRDRITVQYKVETQEAIYGTTAIVWTALAARIPADVHDMLPSRAEGVQQGLEIGRTQTRIRIRHRTDITSAMRIVVHGTTDETYQIVSGPAELGHREQLEMMCERMTS